MGFDSGQDITDLKICVVGLGYVGLPLAVEFGKTFSTVGFDVKENRIVELQTGKDFTREVSADELAAAKKLRFTTKMEDAADSTVFVVTVPTPIDEHNQPDLAPLRGASISIGQVLKPDDVVIYESTVYPGATEEVCVPILERVSGLKFNDGFFVGYSPERINPGDKEHRLASICKITSGSTPQVADFVDRLYQTIVTAGTHKASSIRVAEAAKVIENTQRDLNIALINELALIFNKLDIDTLEVLEAAGTKWNFLPFRPGLVGGHCIGVDPFYLTYKAEQIGHHPEVILAGRRINDGMGLHIASEIVKLLNQKRTLVADARILVLGLAFKENCPDLRNTRVVDMVREFEGHGASVDVYDPWVSAEDAVAEYDICPVKTLGNGIYDAIVLAVAHDAYTEMGAAKIRALGKKDCVLYDVKGVLAKADTDGRL